jgi:hypothetical protein
MSQVVDGGLAATCGASRSLHWVVGGGDHGSDGAVAGVVVEDGGGEEGPVQAGCLLEEEWVERGEHSRRDCRVVASFGRIDWLVLACFGDHRRRRRRRRRRTRGNLDQQHRKRSVFGLWERGPDDCVRIGSQLLPGDQVADVTNLTLSPP